MAAFCYEKCSCEACSHYRMDQEEGRMACFLQKDLTPDEYARYQLLGAIKHQVTKNNGGKVK